MKVVTKCAPITEWHHDRHCMPASELSHATIIVGLGNDLVSDDGVGVYVARRLRSLLDPARYEVQELAVGGMELVERMLGYRRAVVIDACRTGRSEPGTLTRHRVEEFANSPRLGSYHTIDFGTALELARQFKAELPREIVVFAIEADDIETIHEGCTPAVAAAIEPAVGAIVRFLEEV